MVEMHQLSCCTCGMWDLFRSEIKPVSPALEDIFSTTEPPGKPSFFLKNILFIFGCAGSQLWFAGLVVVAFRLSCSVACGILVLWPGIESASPALVGGFLTTGPPGESHFYFCFKWLSNPFSLYIYMHHIFIHSSVDGYLGCFHVLSIVNSVSMNIGVHVSFCMKVSVFSG